jgi:IS605 OrfB family transposase
LKTNPDKFNRVPIRFNIPRSGKFAETKRGNPIVVIASFNGNGRIVLPIKQNGAYKRFVEHLGNGWKCTQFRLHKENGNWVMIANLRKKFKVKQSYRAVVGIDINSGSFAITVLSGEKAMKQLYFGRDIWHKQWKFMKRRSMLQRYADKGSRKARRALRKLKGNERNFVNTRIWQVAHEIVEIARRYDAVIAIEKLKNICKRNDKGEKPVTANRKIYRIPFYKFRRAIQSVAWQSSTGVVEVPAAKTSQRCPRCGYTSKKNWVFINGKRKLFRCIECGYEANPDRVASYNIATLALERGLVSFETTLTTRPQCSRAGGVVSRPVRLDEEVK